MPRKSPEETEEAFWSQVTKDPLGCWLWAGKLNNEGYGRFTGLGQKSTHRYSFALANGGIPSGAHVLHKCHNPSCVRPDHLYAGTQRDNSRDLSNRIYLEGRDWKKPPSDDPVLVGLRSLLRKPLTRGLVAFHYGMGDTQFGRILNGKRPMPTDFRTRFDEAVVSAKASLLARLAAAGAGADTGGHDGEG